MIITIYQINFNYCVKKHVMKELGIEIHVQRHVRWIRLNLKFELVFQNFILCFDLRMKIYKRELK